MTARPVPQQPKLQPPKLVALYRDVDVNGKSGTGVVAWAVVWPDGRVNSWWAQSKVGVHQLGTWKHLGEISLTHGHGIKTRIVHLGTAAAAEQFDTQPLRQQLKHYQAAAVDGLRDSVAHLLVAMQICTALPAMLDAHDALAAAHAQQTAELEATCSERDELRAQVDAMQQALDAIAEAATTTQAEEKDRHA